jgi:membrane protease YdiL (CAAX protease family)
MDFSSLRKTLDKEDKVKTKKRSRRIWEVCIFYLAFGILCLANVAYYAHGFFTLPGAIKLIAAHDPLASSIVVSRIAWFLVIGILIWLLAGIYRLIKSITTGEPFGPSNPRRVRKVAYGVLALASVTFLEQSLQFIMRPYVPLKSLFYHLMGVPMWAAFFGLALLVIARVFEEGLRLKQDENLTI